jgi:hypothetical protein
MPTPNLIERPGRLLPPPPHDPRERIILSRTGDWEVRAFAEGDPKFHYLLRHGMWHLQLWHSGRGVSILTPSALTAGHYEIFSVRGRTVRVRSAAEVVALVERHHDVAAPSVGILTVLEAWFVEEIVAQGAGLRSMDQDSQR